MAYSRCRHCGSHAVPHDAPSPVCGSCVQLLIELGDDVVEPPPAREPGSDDVKPKPVPSSKHDGKWLAWAAVKRKQTRFFHDYGHARGFPRDLRQWSVGMVDQAVRAIQAKPR